MEYCDVCGIFSNEVKLFDAIYRGRMSHICERCSIIENIPIIKRPDSGQLKESEKGAGVYDRMKRLSGIKDIKEDDTFFPEDKLKELDKNPGLETPEKTHLNLIDHFHWELMKHRRRKGLSQKQLAEALVESEIAIQMLEKGKIPENADILLKKLEQFFQVRLRKMSERELMQMQQRQVVRGEMPVLLDRDGKELEVIPEPKIKEVEKEEDYEELRNVIEEDNEKIEEAEIKEDKELEVGKELDVDKESEVRVSIEEPIKEKEIECEEISEGESKDFEIKKSSINAITIDDIRKLHKRKILATRREQIEEQGKIEEREKLIEARKEEIRSRKENESNELDKILGGSELLDKKEGETENSRDLV